MTTIESAAQSTIITETQTTNFFSSGIRQKVDRWMDTLWAGGVNNPMDSIEQLSYMLFLRLLSERDEQLKFLQPDYQPIFSGEWSKYSWANFVTLSGDALFDALRGAIERLHELPNLSGTGKELFRNANLKIYDRPTLKTIVAGVDSLDLAAHDGRDLKGDMYEYLLSKLSQSGTNGQFRTPRHIVNLIVQLVNPQPGERIIDPACGTGGFLVAAYTHILRQHTAPADLARGILDGSRLTTSQSNFLEDHAFTGYDNDANMVKLAIMNLYLHRLEKARIENFNPLTMTKNGQYPGQKYDVILANPPFAGKIEAESILADINLNSRNTELLFSKWFIDHLAPGGRAGVIVPNGVLFGSGKAQTRIRELLLTTCELQAVISLPSGVFKPYSGVGTAILVFESGKTTESVWFYDVTADGFSLDDKRTVTSANDLPDLLSKWPGREEGPNSYRVPIEKIRENDLSLVAGRYKPVTVEAVEYEDPADILREVIALEREIITRSEILLQMLEESK
jgi:type I restriction enzyme M protein